MKSLEKYLPYIVGAVALYFVWDKLKQLGDKTGDTIGKGLVDLLSLDKTDIKVKGGFVLPGGQVIPANVIAANGNTFFSGNTMFVDFNGVRYKAQPRNASGNYPLVRV